MTRVNDADALGSVWNDLGGGAAVSETEFVYQGSASVSEKVKTTESGVRYYNSATSHDYTSPVRTAILKVVVTTPFSLNATASTSMILEIGSGARSAYYRYYAYTDTTYPPDRSWLIEAINPNVSAWRDAVVGSPTLTAIDYYANAARMKGTSAKSENVAMDAIDFVDAGGGLLLTGADGTFDDFLTFDEGTTGNRYGLWSSRQGIFYVAGMHTIGSATATGTFRPNLQTLVFPGGRVAAGFNGLTFDLQNASTDPILQNVTVIGRGRSAVKRWFDSSADEVNGGTEVITISGFTDHGFATGDAVLYSAEGGSAISDLTTNTEYFARRLSATTLSLHTTRQGAIGNTGTRNLTAAGTGEHHSLTRQPDTRPDIVVTGTTGSFDANDCVFLDCRDITLTSAATLLRCVLVTGHRVTTAQGLVTDCSVIDPRVAEGEAFLVTPDLDDITGTTFEAGEEGHAIEITAAGTDALTDNVFTGYGPVKASFNASTGVDGGTEVITTAAAHGFTDGDTVYYGDEGGTPIGGLADGGRYYANSLSSTTLSLHVTRADAVADANRINLTAGSSETHYIYSGRAAILNSSGGLVTINVSGGASPSVRNTPGSTTVVNNDVTVTFDGMKDNTEVRIYAAGTSTELAGIETATAGSTDNRNFAASVAAATSVDYTLFALGYLPITVLAFTWPSSNGTINVQQSIDRNYSNP